MPQNGAIIQASYQNYKASSDLLPFSASYIHKATFGLDDSYIIPTGYVFDFDHDNDVDDDDAYWLMNWVRGYELGTSTPREWLLGPIDHSTPALLTVPGQPLWYFGTATTKAEQQSFDKFADAHSTRRSVIFAGSRSGMLHAFDAGAFRYGDNTCTTVKENRGYFQWTSTCPPIPATPDPDYGTGDELWAFIPANLLPRLKNNLLAKLNQERTSDYDQAYVDASPALADVFINGCMAHGGALGGGQRRRHGLLPGCDRAQQSEVHVGVLRPGSLPQPQLTLDCQDRPDHQKRQDQVGGLLRLGHR